MNRKHLILLPIAALYFSFLFIDLSGSVRFYPLSNALKYASVFLCFTNALLTGNNCFEKKDAAFLKAAMFVTAAADIFLLFTDYFIAGILLFCIVQVIYVARHNRYSKSNTKIYLVIGAEVMAAAFVAVGISGISEKTLVLSGCLYALLSAFSLNAAFRACKSERFPAKNVFLINAGLWLLLLCDVNIFLSAAFPADYLSQRLEWLFYLPSQVLLSYSARK